MTSRMDNGAVLPNGLLSVDHMAMMEGFKKTYQNNSLRFGMIIATYSPSDSGNVTGLAPEYDVVVFEQNENKSSTPITYRNCLSAEGLGSMADFFEKTLRVQTRQSSDIDTKGQNGAIVLILCLNGVSDKGIIIGALTHPDRKSTLVDSGPRLEGEFNGVNIKVEKDGSTSLTFKGATDNDGKITDTTQGPTILSVEKDGSLQFSHKTITQRFDKSGVSSLTTDDNISNTTKKSFSVDATENASITAGKKISLKGADLAASISGSCIYECGNGKITSTDAFGIKASTLKLEAESMVNVKAPSIVLEGLVSLGGQGGLPVLTLGTTFFGIGNLGIPVLSRAIAGFSTKATAV